jgi:hypothetical protein
MLPEVLGFQARRGLHDAYNLGFRQSAVSITPATWISEKCRLYAVYD